MNIDHGLMNVWTEGDAIIRAVALLLLASREIMIRSRWLKTDLARPDSQGTGGPQNPAGRDHGDR
jgi:hypothetical protein